MTEAIVYVPHQPFRWSHELRRTVEIDISPAARYGSLFICLPGLNRPPPAPVAVRLMRESLKQFRPCDYLLVAGDIDLLVWASMLAVRASGGKLTLLRWDNRSRSYIPAPMPEGLLDGDLENAA